MNQRLVMMVGLEYTACLWLTSESKGEFPAGRQAGCTLVDSDMSVHLKLSDSF